MLKRGTFVLLAFAIGSTLASKVTRQVEDVATEELVAKRAK
jgi:hypothetical protein